MKRITWWISVIPFTASAVSYVPGKSLEAPTYWLLMAIFVLLLGIGYEPAKDTK